MPGREERDPHDLEHREPGLRRQQQDDGERDQRARTRRCCRRRSRRRRRRSAFGATSAARHQAGRCRACDTASCGSRLAALTAERRWDRQATACSATSSRPARRRAAPAGHRAAARRRPPDFARPLAEDHDADGLEQDARVEPERPVLDVEEVVPHLLGLFLEVVRVAVAHLRPAGDARAHGGCAARSTRSAPRRSRGWPIGCGRGPIRFISPRSTLTSCGSSSSRKRRSQRPSGVMRSRLSCTHSDRGVVARVHRAELQQPERPCRCVRRAPA